MSFLKFKSGWVPVVLSFLVSSSVLETEAKANIGEAFGFGSRVAGLAGNGVAGNAGAFAAYHNPGELGVDSDKRLQLSYGLVFMQPTFRPITNVVTQNLFNADGDVTGNVDNSTYRSTLGQELGFSYRLSPEFMNLTIGVVTFLPLNAVAYMDTGDAYAPEYFMYRARTQRPQIEAAIGAKLGKGFHFGTGIHFGFGLTGNASVFINTLPGTASSMRFVSSLVPKAAPYFGLLYKPEDDPEKYSFGAVFRLPVASNNTMVLNSAARVFGDFAAVDFNFTALSTLFYDPMTLELGGAWKHSSWGKSYLQLEYQAWSAYQTPALLIQQPTTSNCQGETGGTTCTVNIAAGRVPPYQFVDIVVARAGEELSLNESTTLRFGYAYRPTILSSLSNGEGNYLDPPKHMLNLGLGFQYKHFLGFEVANQLDFHASYQYLVLQHIVKTSGNETGNASDPKIGSPGYDAGGNLLGGGVSLSLAF